MRKFTVACFPACLGAAVLLVSSGAVIDRISRTAITEESGGTVITGACCFQGMCTELTEQECAAAGGVYFGDFTNCITDCNSNGTADVCELDCNSNGTFDGCEPDADCDSNGTPDICDPDCNSNGTPDPCDILAGSADANHNGTPDECERDCNTNGTQDSIDISSGSSADADSNGIPDECCVDGFTYTSAADFNQGYFFNTGNVNIGGDDCIALDNEIKAWPFIGVANSSRGTLVRIDINTGDVLGEYLTSPDGTLRSPSRTTVDQFGNIWVGNRDEAGLIGGAPKGSVTRIGLVIGGTRGDKDIFGNFTANPLGNYLQGPFAYNTCDDRDNDGLIKTSRGYPQVTGSTDYVNTILPWPNTASADTAGGVSTAEDECITAYTRVAGTGVRFVGIDPAGDIWTGGIFNQLFEKLDGNTALPVPFTVFNSINGGYGGLVDGNNVIWSAWGLMRFAVPGGPAVLLPTPAYGVGIDPKTCHIWTTNGNRVYEVDPSGLQLNNYLHNVIVTFERGIVVDRSSTLWVAHSFTTTLSNTVGRQLTDGTFIGNVDLDTNPSTVNGRTPTGVAVDTNDKIWVTNLTTHNAMRIDPAIGVAGAVDLVVDLGSGSFPYNYSDMTGNVLLQATAPQGSWTVIRDSTFNGTEWNLIQWTAIQDPGTTVTVRVRASDSPLPSGPWTNTVNGVPFTSIFGRYLQIQVKLTRPIKSNAAVALCDLTVCNYPPPCMKVTNEVLRCSLVNPNEYWYCFDLTNCSGVPFYHLFLVPNGGVTMTPNIISLTPPLLNGQTRRIQTPYPPGITIGNASPQNLCFFITALDEFFQTCCVIKHTLLIELDCGPGACCRPCPVGGCVNVASAAECGALNGTYFPGINCTTYLCPHCPFPWDVLVAVPVGGGGLSDGPAGELVVSNLGSSGEDGVRLELPPTEMLQLDWADLDPGGTVPDGAQLQARLSGTYKGVPGQLLGIFDVTDIGMTYEIEADFYLVGSFGLNQVVEVYNGGVFVAGASAPVGPVATATQWPRGSTAKRRSGPDNAPYFAFTWPAPVTIQIPGIPPAVGDELRIVARNPAGLVDELSNLTLQAADIPTITLTSVMLTAPTFCGGDCNGDMVRDGSDAQTFTTCFITGAAGCECADFDQSGTIEPADLTAMVNAMLSNPACP